MQTLPYVYKLTHKETNEFYFGYRCANKVPASDDLGIYYFTSSKTVSKRFEEFRYEVLKEFNNKNDAYWYEQSLIESQWKQDGLLNKKYQADSGRGMFRQSGPLTEEHKRKISLAQKGVPKSIEHNLKVSLAQKGRPLSEKHKASLRKPKTITEELLIAHFKLKGKEGKSRPRECSCIKCHKNTSSNYINRHICQITNN